MGEPRTIAGLGLAGLVLCALLALVSAPAFAVAVVSIVFAGAVGFLGFRATAPALEGDERPDDQGAALEALETSHRKRIRDMVETLAHELRNPLAGMKGNLQLMEATYPTGTQSHSDAVELVRDVVRLEQIVQGLLTFVRAADIDRTPCDPGAIIRRTVNAMPRGTFETDVPTDLGDASLDGDRVGDALRALLQNAVQAGGEGPVVVTARREGDILTIMVRDRGDGVAEADRERIFSPFYTTRTRGLGLGLALARQTVEAHGGRIEADTHPEGGAVFVMTLPGAS